MKSYIVTWEMEIVSTSPRQAAVEALEIHHDPASIATAFMVGDPEEKQTHFIDLDDMIEDHVYTQLGCPFCRSSITDSVRYDGVLNEHQCHTCGAAFLV